MPDLLALADFTPHIGSSFRLLDVSGVTLVLSHAKAIAPMKAGGRPQSFGGREPFDLIFLGPSEPILPQQIYRMETEGMGAVEIFIVPIGPQDGGIGYQAIFT
jgi:hypothetical protein